MTEFNLIIIFIERRIIVVIRFYQFFYSLRIQWKMYQRIALP
jgi:hypothetical protein